MPADPGSIENGTGTVESQESSSRRRETRDEYTHVSRKRLFYNLVNSTAVYIFAYLLSYLFYQLVTMACAYLLGIPAVLYYYEIVYGISNNSPEWTTGKILVISAAAPLLSLMGGYFFLFGIVRKFILRQYQMLFMIWTGFHLLNFFLGGILAGSLTNCGLGYTLDIMFWPLFFIYVILSLIGIFCLVMVGNEFKEHFLKTNPSTYWSKRKNRRQYLILTLVFPWLIGSMLMFLIKLPDHPPQHTDITIHDLILSLSIIFLILPMFFKRKNAQFRPKTFFTERKRNILWFLVISTIVLVICFRLGLTMFFYSLFT